LQCLSYGASPITDQVLGATGLSMVYEICLQLREEAGKRQAQGARRGLIENGGGVMGFDEAVCAVHILERLG
ncbi:MAG: hypothetical protein EBX57_12670, partial [Betaproteobacteria bacterium]|nr:hypothetical protein [Betaproteobacteria bacterium]